MAIQSALSSARLGLVLIYFIYGLAFFTLGIALTLENWRSPKLLESRALLPLALFGLLHGVHEWLEIILLQGVWLGTPFPQELQSLRVGLLALSFLPLVFFGLRMLFSKSSSWLAVVLTGFCLSSYFLIIFINAQRFPAEVVAHGDILARYLLAVPGGILAGLAAHCRGRQLRSEGRRALGDRFLWAAVGFGLYGLTQVLVQPAAMFPARLINASLFLAYTGIPIQIIRAGLALTIAASLLSAIRWSDFEREQQLLDAQRLRLAALEQIQRELEQREIMRKELLSHTVIAQEEERSRIARELHDETAQILSAFSLNLATLRSSISKRSPANEVVDRLNDLCRQMSHGLFRLVNDLRPPQLDDLGLAAALQHQAEICKERFGLQVNVSFSGNRVRLNPLVETVIFRVAQEALTNVGRHARVNEAFLEVTISPEQVRLEVCDRGAGFNPAQELVPPHGWGLAGMRERVEAIGGEFTIDSAPGKGTRVMAAIQLEDLRQVAVRGDDHE